MKLTGFQVRMFKSIIDSGWIEVDPLTVLVGKNESGKTSILKCLHKFNPFKPEPYSIKNEWPRAKRDERSDDFAVCTAEFEFSPDEKAHLSSLTEAQMTLDRVRITKDYAGKFEVMFPQGVFPDKLHPNDIDLICKSMSDISSPVGEAFRVKANDCRAEASRLAHEGRFTELSTLKQSHVAALTALQNPSNPQHQHEQTYIDQTSQSLDQVTNALSSAPSMHRKAHDYIVSRLPTFVYMDEYKSFQGTALIDQVKQRKDGNQLTPEDKTFQTILELSALNLDSLVAQNTPQGKEERQYDVDDGAATLTEKIAKHWGALKYKVEFRLDGMEFFTHVKDEKDKALIKLEERSKGFQWFFSFDLLLMHETKGTMKQCVILLDEPGLHLHPGAQKDLLGRLQEYAAGNTLIYSTHLPFMLNLQHPERIRVISETSIGSQVTSDLTKSQPDAKLTLQAALGMSASTSYLVAQQNLVVEGVDDYWFLTALSDLLVRSDKAGLPEGIHITPAGGASEVTYIATFMIGQELDVVALYDTDTAGNTAKDKLVKNWLTKYQTSKSAALSIGEVVGVAASQEFSIEDLFPEDFYLKYVSEAYKLQLAANSITSIALLPGAQLVKRVEAFFEKFGLKFNKGSIAKRICADIRKMPTISSLPTDTLAKIEKIISKITNAFPANSNDTLTKTSVTAPADSTPPN